MPARIGPRSAAGSRATEELDYALLVDDEGRPLGWIDRHDLAGDGPIDPGAATPGAPTVEPETTLRDALSALLELERAARRRRRRATSASSASSASMRSASGSASRFDRRWDPTRRRRGRGRRVMRPGEPFIRFDWIIDNLDEIGQRLGEHVVMVVAAVVIGFVVSFALALDRAAAGARCTARSSASPARSTRSRRWPCSSSSSRSPASRSRPGSSRSSSTPCSSSSATSSSASTACRPTSPRPRPAWATAPRQRFWRVELPIAVPVIIAGLRIATVTTIGLVTITTFIGLGGLGYLIINSGTRRFFPTSIYVGVVAVRRARRHRRPRPAAGIQRRLTPWAQARTGRPDRWSCFGEAIAWLTRAGELDRSAQRDPPAPLGARLALGRGARRRRSLIAPADRARGSGTPGAVPARSSASPTSGARCRRSGGSGSSSRSPWSCSAAAGSASSRRSSP